MGPEKVLEEMEPKPEILPWWEMELGPELAAMQEELVVEWPEEEWQVEELLVVEWPGEE